MAMPAPGVPVFKLYGEQLDWPTEDLLHCESIPQRSSQHGWEIKPHRHADLLQLLYVQQGLADVEIEGRTHRIERPALLVVPPLTIHGFRFSADIQGYVVTLSAPLLESLQGALDGAVGFAAQPACHLLGEAQAQLDPLLATLQREYQQRGPGRDLSLRSLVALLMVWVARQGVPGPARRETLPRGHGLLAQFGALVEAHYREHWGIERYARELGISAAHLNGLCRRLAGQSALQVVHQRLLLEAKRDLIYTAMTVNQISDYLGFSEPAYFSRYFRRLTGQSPNAYRKVALPPQSIGS
ncbi:AraC family transcriptional regulator [Stutzerimonas nosocomialis]|uniref:AraC family transcriptional regulator n=2 Tax=Stutzerimonas nosocomialis TaxID=1056496 RepID=A0A5R9QIG5_9GAMM|nr:AraC family transcriptional regulator [Stutzerimonas nosocomialis]TLX65019.1 AraC family transcriptional regulator [Stutzerimonas nosocomialis]